MKACLNMRDPEWNTLAVITFQKQLSFEEITCVCSRLFVCSEDEPSDSDEDENTDLEKTIVKYDVENEPVSCYYSASHTDTLSTDEHDSLRESLEGRPLLWNDSSADTILSGKQDVILEWQKFWSLNGEKLIWESWITKYSDYINPEYIGLCGESCSHSGTDSNIKSEISRSQLSKFNFDENELTNGQRNNPKGFQRELSENDDTVNNDISEGWNPLSPLSNDGDAENEHLLRPRCSSHTGSSVRTVDSMTNVTRMTISSIDFNKSPPDSLSSVSSVESSVSSISSSGGDEDNENEWNHLWKIHYEQEYLIQYNKFLVDRDCNNTSESSIPESSHTIRQKQSKVKHCAEKEENNCPAKIFSNLEVNNETDETFEESDKDELCSEEAEQMIALGLPLSFGSFDDSDSKKGSKRLPNKNRGRSSANDKNNIQAIFHLLGIEFTKNNQELLNGKVEYKMKHIRAQNSSLKMRGVKRIHIFFDDDGNPIPDDRNERKDESAPLECFELKENDVKSTEPAITERPKKSARRRSRRKKKEKNYSPEAYPSQLEYLSNTDYPPEQDFPPEIKENPKLKKYWYKRFSLFTRFDEGIKLDPESWYSVTPEPLARVVAERCSTEVIVDGFCGAGGNTIQFAKTCKKVIAIDIDPKKIELAKNNAAVYGVLDKIEFIIGDYMTLAPKLEANVVFLSPPWGGPSYKYAKTYDLENMLQPAPYSELMKATKCITNNIAVFLPRNCDASEVVKYAGDSGFVQIEQCFVRNSQIGLTIYYNDLVQKRCNKM